MATKLWVEAHRPTTIADYVFKDAVQKRQVEGWINDKSIPHLLFSGSAGIGKCLIGSELIDIQIDISTLSELQITQLAQYKV